MTNPQLEQNWISLTGRPDYVTRLRRWMNEATEEEKRIIFEMQKIILSKMSDATNLNISLKKLNRENKQLREQVHSLSNRLASRR